MSDELKLDWNLIRQRVGPFPPEAFQFVREGLQHTVRMVHGDDAAESMSEDESRHVTGQQLCLGLRDFAIRQFGLLAKLVLGRWGVHSTDDFGKIVFAMIEAGLMRKTDEDTLGDFRAVYDFSEAFLTPANVVRPKA